MKSIVSNEKECLICGTPFNLHRHHVFYGRGIRSQSEKHGCWCYLCGYHHNLSDHGVHFDKASDLKLKRMFQQRLEDNGWQRPDFIRVFGRSYL